MRFAFRFFVVWLLLIVSHDHLGARTPNVGLHLDPLTVFGTINEAIPFGIIVRRRYQFHVARDYLLGKRTRGFCWRCHLPRTLAWPIGWQCHDLSPQGIHDHHRPLRQERMRDIAVERAFHLGQLLLDLVWAMFIVRTGGLHFHPQVIV